MDDLPGILTRDFGFRPQGKSAPMKPTSIGSGSSRSSAPASDNVRPNGSLFDGFKDPNPHSSAGSMPAYDDDIFGGTQGMKSSVKAEYDDVFSSRSPKKGHVEGSQPDDDLLGSVGKGSGGSGGVDDLISGFGGSSPQNKRESPESYQQKATQDDPFVVLEKTSGSADTSSGFSNDPLEQLGNPTYSGRPASRSSSVSEGAFNNIDGLAKSSPSPRSDNTKKVKSPTNSSSPMFFENVAPKKGSSVQSPNSVDSPYGRYAFVDRSPKSYHSETDIVWLTVSEVPLFTQPTSSPPPSRPPPQPRRKQNQSFSHSSPRYYYPKDSTRKHNVSMVDELEDFAMGKPEVFSNGEDVMMKHANDSRNREKIMSDTMDPEEYDMEREYIQKEKEEQRRLEREREQELARESIRARQAMDRAAKEAQERSAAELLRAQRAAVEKANAEARQRAERNAIQRAAAEARERAAAEARARAARAAAEAREKAAKERAAAAARERAARERASASAREKQYAAESELDSFFFMDSRTNKSPKQRATTAENIFDNQAGDASRRPSSTSWSTNKKETSTTNIVDDLTSIFGATPSSVEFQEVEGESEERRRARLERHQRTVERAAKALAEKNERDMQTQREQAEKERIGETLDIEIKRWAAGKEGNLRALLSTLQYVLWPECGWQPVSLTDLITAASVKKVYRKATLCIHPDKVQQKGANLQQKYIAEKVFDLLKEAWNKFNSEELF